jgi:apolipoprotein N-acyltransferase
MSEQQLAFSKLRAVELDRYTVVASNVGISALVTPDGRELGRTRFFTPAYLDNQVRLKTTLTPAAKWGPIVQGILVASAVTVLLAAILHNGWFAELNRRLSELMRKPARSDGDPPGDDVVADGDEVSTDAGLDEDDEDTTVGEDGQYSARGPVQRPEKGDI